MFREDFSTKFVALFTVLLFLKAFHWLVEDRVDYVSKLVYEPQEVPLFIDYLMYCFLDGKKSYHLMGVSFQSFL